MKVIAINRGSCGSMIFESVWDENKYDAMLTFCWRNGLWCIGMFTQKENIDVGSVCKKFGGGGHKGAGGFECINLPFKLGKEI